MPRSRKTRKVKDPFARYVDSGWSWFINENAKHPSDPRVFFKIYQFKCPCDDPHWSEWQSLLAGAEDGEFCENPACANNGPVKPTGKPIINCTPCAFPNCKYYGEYQCHQCGRYWESGHAWTNSFQKCEECIINIYPFNMDEHQTRPKRLSNKPHQEHLCQKCIELGGKCFELLGSGGCSDNRSGRFYRRKRNRKGRKSAAKKKQDEGIQKAEQGSGDAVTALLAPQPFPSVNDLCSAIRKAMTLV